MSGSSSIFDPRAQCTRNNHYKLWCHHMELGELSEPPNILDPPLRSGLSAIIQRRTHTLIRKTRCVRFWVASSCYLGYFLYIYSFNGFQDCNFYANDFLIWYMYIYHLSPLEGQCNLVVVGGGGTAPLPSLISRPHFSRPPEKWVWSTAYSIFVQVRRNVGALFFSNLTLDVIEDCIPHCVWTIY